MAQLEELSSLAGAVQTQTANAALHTRSNAGAFQPQTETRSPGFQSEEDREVIYGELKRLLNRREILRCLFCVVDVCGAHVRLARPFEIRPFVWQRKIKAARATRGAEKEAQRIATRKGN